MHLKQEKTLRAQADFDAGWEAWAEHGVEWHTQVDLLLNTNQYLKLEFLVEERLQEARVELERARQGGGNGTGFASEAAAQRWLQKMTQRRVQEVALKNWIGEVA